MYALPQQSYAKHQEALDRRRGLPTSQKWGPSAGQYCALWQARTPFFPHADVGPGPRRAAGNVALHRVWRGRVHPRARPSVAVHSHPTIS